MGMRKPLNLLLLSRTILIVILIQLGKKKNSVNIRNQVNLLSFVAIWEFDEFYYNKIDFDYR